jgi:hypothetical protein
VDAGVAGELRVAVEALDRADLAEQLGGADCATAGQLEQPPSGREHLLLQFAIEREDRAGEAAATAEEFARDPHLDALLAAGEAPCEPVEPDASVERAERDRE